MSLLNRPLLGFAAFFGISSIIGSGFCFWIFSENGNIPYAEINNLTIDYSVEASIGHFAKGFENKAKPILMVFTEGNSSDDLNEGIEFYKQHVHEPTGAYEYVNDDSVTIEFHKDKSFDENKYGLQLQLGVQVELLTTIEGITPITKFIHISDDLYKDDNFVNLTNSFDKEDFLHEEFTDEDTGLDIPSGSPYTRYTYTMHVNDLFAYTDFSVKPTTAEKYTTLYNAYKEAFNNGNKGWKINIKFTARYVEKTTNVENVEKV